MKSVLYKKGEVTTLILLVGLAVIAIAGILTPPAKKNITNTKAAGSCAEIVSVSYLPSPIASGAVMNTSVIISAAYSGSQNIAVGWSKNGAWPQNGGLWQGATCNGTNCTFTIRMDQYASGTADIYELVGFDMTASCGPTTGKKIPITLQSSQAPSSTPMPPTPTRGVTLPTVTNTPIPTTPPYPTSTPRPGVPTATPTRGNNPTSVPTNTPIPPTATSTPTKGPDCAQIQSMTYTPAKVASDTNFGCTVTVDAAHKDSPNIYCTLMKNGNSILNSAITYRGRCYGTTCNSTLNMDTYSSQTSERYELVAYDGTLGCGSYNSGKRTAVMIYTSVPTNTPSPTPKLPTATPTPTRTAPSNTPVAPTSTPRPNETVTPTRGFMPTTIPPSVTPSATPAPPTATPKPTTLPDCIPLETHGSNEDKLDIVFVPNNFTDSEIGEFLDAANKAIKFAYQNGISSELSKVNFYAYSHTENNMIVKFEDIISGGVVIGQLISMDDPNVATDLGHKCHSDSVVVIIKSDKWGGTAYSGWNVAMVTVPGVETAVHEMGHSIVGLGDEYDKNKNAAFTDSPRPNCSAKGSSDESTPCPGWEAYSDAGCYKTCNFSDWYRPTNHSIMNAWDGQPNKFNEISIEEWRKVLKNYK